MEHFIEALARLVDFEGCRPKVCEVCEADRAEASLADDGGGFGV